MLNNQKLYIFLYQQMKKLYSLLLILLISFSSIAGGEDTKLFSLFPVPLRSSVLKVKLNVAISEPLTIELRNLIGKKLQEKTFPKGVDEISFQDMNYPNGLYVVLAKDAYGKIIESSKFLIDK